MGIIEINKNWVTVRDKCPQINVQFNIFFRMDGLSDYIMPQILFGGIKIHILSGDLQHNEHRVEGTSNYLSYDGLPRLA